MNSRWEIIFPENVYFFAPLSFEFQLLCYCNYLSFYITCLFLTLKASKISILKFMILCLCESLISSNWVLDCFFESGSHISHFWEFFWDFPLIVLTIFLITFFPQVLLLYGELPYWVLDHLEWFSFFCLYSPILHLCILRHPQFYLTDSSIKVCYFLSTFLILRPFVLSIFSAAVFVEFLAFTITLCICAFCCLFP